ncbi:hypothetical protein, partial [Lysobacter sp. 22409]|uniref:hypothetical protein n=1 Tax=Lysobacter sp. 22409 TaxID=3453917 RepID=UPI003F863542
WPVPLQGEPFSLVSFLLGLAKESNPAALADGSSALAYGFHTNKIKRLKLPPLKRRVTFFCHKQQKKGNQRKMLFFESRARTRGAYAGLFHTGHPCPDEKRRASLRAALRVFYCLRKCETAHGKSKSGKARQIIGSDTAVVRPSRRGRGL